MFRDWFGSSAPRARGRNCSFRPQLECLEGRLAPSGVAPMDDHGPHGPHGPPGPPGPHGPPAPGGNGISSGVNAHGSFNNSTITDSFNNTINNTVIMMPAQQSSVQGLLGISGLLAGALNSPQLGSLLDDEIALAVDTYLTTPPISSLLPASVVSSLTSDKTVLSSAISANPLESNPVGQLIGTLAFDMTLNALTTAQATI
jgi:hypothetical protein